MLRITETAQRLARERQAVSAHTAAELVVEIARSEGIVGLPDEQIRALAADMCELIAKGWTAPGPASRL